ncbi:hypothetical protein EGY20_03630 [Burkholderia multivorans]|nr:hypothetical protein EGY20_03630 [Burkholderia multivorans]PRE59135.1 hypothetical protein C6P86_25095 [Burkholderia multivorans]PRE77646.1 hypothetical protein C6Q00_26815 [Burkholderia multivorans]PRG18652.1 hypothetical protein C6T57_23520 [Burkholderia multivorans]
MLSLWRARRTDARKRSTAREAAPVQAGGLRARRRDGRFDAAATARAACRTGALRVRNRFRLTTVNRQTT